MDAEIFARLTNWLFSHRQIRTVVPKGSRFKDGEKDLAYELDLLDGDDRAYLEDFFAFSGFSLKIFDWTEYPGIPKGGQIWGIVRNPAEEAPGWFSEREVRQRLCDGVEPKNVTTVWAFVIYLHYLHLAYTRLDRHPSEITRYVDAIFSKEELVEGLRQYVDQLGEEHADVTEAVTILTAERGQEIERRVGKLLDFLAATGCLVFNKDDQAYSQTLLGAADVAEHFDWEIEYLLPKANLNEDALGEIILQSDDEKEGDHDEPDQPH